MNNFDQLLKDNKVLMQEWFEHLHANPELSFKEFETTKYIIEQLSKLENIKIETPCETGCVGILKGKLDGPTIALRADIDALQITEETDVPYKSKNDNVMHACGHDAHTTSLLAVAQILNGEVDKLKGSVKFIFQAAEEAPPGGAVDIVKSGVLNDCDFIFGAHLMPNMPTGKIALKPGFMFVASDRFDITIQGKGGHAAMPNMSVDPVIIQAEMIIAFQSIVSRKTNPLFRPTISTTVVNTAPGANNVIPDTVNLKGSVRNLDNATRQETAEWVKKIANGVCQMHGATADIEYVFGYDPVVNDDAAYEYTLKAAHNFLDEKDIVIMKEPIPGSEDFGAYCSICPSSYFLYGGANKEKGTDVMVHHPKYKVDQDALYYGAMMFLNIVEELLMK